MHGVSANSPNKSISSWGLTTSSRTRSLTA